MAIASATPDAPSQIVTNIPKIEEKPYKGIVVDTQYTPLSSLISYIEGATWTVNYYSQVLDKNNDLRTQDVGQDPVYQAYTEILEMEMKVSSVLTATQDAATSRMTVTGTATTFPFLIPNAGDMFVADVGDGREGVFQVTNSEKRTILKDSVYVIDYVLMYYVDLFPTKAADLKVKSIKSTHYVRDFMLNGQAPTLIDTEYNAYKELIGKFSLLANLYTKWFFVLQYQTLLVPGQPTFIYDHFIAKTILSILSVRDTEHVQYIRRLNLDDDEYFKQDTLLSAMVKRDKTILALANKQMGTVSTMAFDNNPMSEGIRFININKVIYPLDPDMSMLSTGETTAKTALDNDIVSVPLRAGITSTMLASTTIAGVTIPFIKPVLVDNYYILSSNFYTNTGTQSVLEILVNDYFSAEAINSSALLELANQVPGWNGLEKFYYIPVILMLIRSVIGNM